jgi:hypothetical protein
LIDNITRIAGYISKWLIKIWLLAEEEYTNQLPMSNDAGDLLPGGN